MFTDTLTTLSMSKNNLRRVPSQLAFAFPRLIRLYLYENDLQTLPSSLSLLTKLDT
jgi:Leucine-rich repeat (LRR) protein